MHQPVSEQARSEATAERIWNAKPLPVEFRDSKLSDWPALFDRSERRVESRACTSALPSSLQSSSAMSEKARRKSPRHEQPHEAGAGHAPEVSSVADAPVEVLITMVRTGAQRGSHACLGLPVDAAHEACRKRYHALAKRIHPDKTAAPGAAEAFQALEAAFHAIVD